MPAQPVCYPMHMNIDADTDVSVEGIILEDANKIERSKHTISRRTALPRMPSLDLLQEESISHRWYWEYHSQIHREA